MHPRPPAPAETPRGSSPRRPPRASRRPRGRTFRRRPRSGPSPPLPNRSWSGLRSLDQDLGPQADRQRVLLRVQVRAPAKLPRLLLGVKRQPQGVRRLVEVGWGEERPEGIRRAEREEVGLVVGDELPHGPGGVSGLAAVLLKRHAAEREACPVVVAELLIALVVLE